MTNTMSVDFSFTLREIMRLLEIAKLYTPQEALNLAVVIVASLSVPDHDRCIDTRSLDENLKALCEVIRDVNAALYPAPKTN